MADPVQRKNLLDAAAQEQFDAEAEKVAFLIDTRDVVEQARQRWN